MRPPSSSSRVPGGRHVPGNRGRHWGGTLQGSTAVVDAPPVLPDDVEPELVEPAEPLLPVEPEPVEPEEPLLPVEPLLLLAPRAPVEPEALEEAPAGAEAAQQESGTATTPAGVPVQAE